MSLIQQFFNYYNQYPNNIRHYSYSQLKMQPKANVSQKLTQIVGPLSAQKIKQIVELYWGMAISTMQHLVGYDVINYLIQAEQSICKNNEKSKMKKFIVKVYTNCSENQLQYIYAQNQILQYLNNKDNSNSNYNRYPKSVRLTNVQNQHKQQVKQISQNLNDIFYQNQYALTFRLINNQPINCQQVEAGHVVCIRVVQFIEGTMLGSIINTHLQPTTHTQNQSQNTKQCKQKNLQIQQYNILVSSTIPKFIAECITIPLSTYTHILQTQLLHSGSKSPVLSICKGRKFHWHIQSFLTNKEYYQDRQQMIVSNNKRPKWHSEIIQYFVTLYRNVHQQLISQQKGGNQKLRRNIIYNDANQWNIVVNSSLIHKSHQLHQVSMIDFGDIVYSYLIQDISLYTLYILYNTPDPQRILQYMPAIMRAYSQIVPITESELKLYFVTVPMRMCLSLCNSEHAMQEKPEDEYVSMSQKNGWRLLQIMRQLYGNVGSQGHWQIFNSELFQQIEKVTMVSEKLGEQTMTLERKNQGTKFTIENIDVNFDLNRDDFYWNDYEQQLIKNNKYRSKYNKNSTGQSHQKLDYSYVSYQQIVFDEDDQQSYETSTSFETQIKNKQIDKLQELAHIEQLFRTYYGHMLVGEGRVVDVKILPGYSLKNCKISIYHCNNRPQKIYVMKLYPHYEGLQDQIEIQSYIKEYLAKQNTHFGKQINSISIPRTVPIGNDKQVLDRQSSNKDRRHKFSYHIYDEFWSCELSIRLLTYVHGQSYSAYINLLDIQPKQIQFITNYQKQCMQHLDDKLVESKQYRKAQIKENLNKLCKQRNNSQQYFKIKAKINKLYHITERFGFMLGTVNKTLSPSPILKYLATHNYTLQEVYTTLIRYNFQWNWEQTHVWITRLHYVQNQRIRQLIRYFVQLYKENVLAQNAKAEVKLRKSVMHMDPTQDNCIISDPYAQLPSVDGLIDFDQVQIGYIINDLACTLSHCFYTIPKIDKTNQNKHKNRLNSIYKECLGILVSRYNSINPLTYFQISSIYYMVAIRVGFCIVLESRDICRTPGNNHIDFDMQILCQYLTALSVVDPKQFQYTIMNACRTYTPREIDKNSIRKSKYGEYYICNIDQQQFQQKPKGNCPVHQIHKLIQYILCKYTAISNKIKKSNSLFQDVGKTVDDFVEHLWSYDWIKVKMVSDNRGNKSRLNTIKQVLVQLGIYQHIMSKSYNKIQCCSDLQKIQEEINNLKTQIDSLLSKLKSVYGLYKTKF